MMALLNKSKWLYPVPVQKMPKWLHDIKSMSCLVSNVSMNKQCFSKSNIQSVKENQNGRMIKM